MCASSSQPRLPPPDRPAAAPPACGCSSPAKSTCGSPGPASTSTAPSSSASARRPATGPRATCSWSPSGLGRRIEPESSCNAGWARPWRCSPRTRLQSWFRSSRIRCTARPSDRRTGWSTRTRSPAPTCAWRASGARDCTSKRHSCRHGLAPGTGPSKRHTTRSKHRWSSTPPAHGQGRWRPRRGSSCRFDRRASWWGYYELTPDHDAILGRHPAAEGWIDAAGFSGHGVQHAAMVARLIAEEVVDGRATTIDLAPLRHGRLAHGAARKEANIV